MCISYIGNILYDKELLNKDKKLVVFGCGMYGKRIAKYLEERDMRDNIVCFCDSNNYLANHSVMGIPVKYPLEVCKCYPDADYLISGKYSREMYSLLKENSIERIHFIVF